MHSARIILGVVTVLTILGIQAGNSAEPDEFLITYLDGRSETVTDLWEFYKREAVRELCYIEEIRKPHVPNIPYTQIKSIVFSEYKDNPRLNRITVTLVDGSVQKGFLWGNDSFFATDVDGNEWRARVVSLSRIDCNVETAPEKDPSDSETSSP